MTYLLYPQVILTLWAPLLIWLLSHLTRHWRQGLAPVSGFRVSLGLLLLPTLMWWVPYLPGLPLRELLPYRVPIAWGVYNGSHEFTRLEWWLLTLPAALAFGSMMLATLYGMTEGLVARWRVARLPGQRVGNVMVLDLPGDLAFTLGTFRPRIYISRSLWESPHRAAVLAHEQAHAQGKHGIWLALARWSRRSLCIWPWAGQLLREVQTWAELLADDRAVRVAGKPALARALGAMLPASAPRPALSFSSPGTLTRRVGQLVRPGHTLSPAVHLGLALAFVALLILV